SASPGSASRLPFATSRNPTPPFPHAPEPSPQHRRSTMTRTALITIAGAFAACAVLTATATGAHSQAWTMTLDAQQSETHFIDNAPKGESPGDVIAFTDTLRRHGTVVGFA